MAPIGTDIGGEVGPLFGRIAGAVIQSAVGNYLSSFSSTNDGSIFERLER